MRYVILIFVFISGLLQVSAQNIIDERTATVVSYWDVGNSKTYT